MARRRIVLPAALCAAALAPALTGRAAAQPAPSAVAAAEALFQEGRALLMAGQVGEACPKLEESQRLDPATGTLLALALCHEQQGKLASAWAEFADAEARSRVEGRADRERTAREHGAALRPRLSTLTVEVPGDAALMAGLTIIVDGVQIGQAAWNTAIPVDGGAHRVEALAPGRLPWSASVSVGPGGDRARVAVSLAVAPPPPRTAAAPDPAAAPVVKAAAAVPAPEPAAAPAASAPVRRAIGVAVLSAGVVALGVSLLIALDAKGDYDAAIDDCSADGSCPVQPYGHIQDARERGDIATVLALAGGAAAVVGAALWVWPRPSRADHTASAGVRLRMGPAGLAFSARF
jgi:hypothetical protein